MDEGEKGEREREERREGKGEERGEIEEGN